MKTQKNFLESLLNFCKNNRCYIYLPIIFFVITSAVLFNVSFRKKNVATDFISFYYANKAVLLQGDIYDTSYLNRLAKKDKIKKHVFPYLYPPVLAYLAAPLAKMPPADAQHLWSLLNLVALSIMMTLIIKMLETWKGVKAKKDDNTKFDSFDIKNILLSLTVFFLFPFDNNFHMGQINVLVLTAIVFSLWAWSNDRPILSGFFLSLSAIVKITPGMLIFFFLARKNYKAIVSFFVGLFIISAISLTTGSYESWIKFLKLIPVYGSGSTIPGLADIKMSGNYSFMAIYARILPQASISIITATTILFLTGLTTFFVYKHKNDLTARLALLPYLVIMIMASPYSWLHHMIYVYPAVIITLFELRSFNIKFVLVLIATVFLGPDWYVIFNRLGISWHNKTSIIVYALIVLMILGFWIIGKGQKTTSLKIFYGEPKQAPKQV